DGGLDILRIVVAAIDGDQIRNSAGDVELTIEIDAQIAGTQPGVLDHRALSAAALLAGRPQCGAERPPGLFRPAPVAATDVVALQPDFADLTVGQLGTGIRVDDHSPQAAGRVTTRHLRNSAGGISSDAHRATSAQLIPVEIGDTRFGVVVD